LVLSKTLNDFDILEVNRIKGGVPLDKNGSPWDPATRETLLGSQVATFPMAFVALHYTSTLRLFIDIN